MKTLIINPRTGIAGDMLFSAILDLLEKEQINPNIEKIQELLKKYGTFKIETIEKKVREKRIQGKKITTKYEGEHISFLKASHLIDTGIKFLGINRKYALIARRALEILINAETKAHQILGKEKNKAQKIPMDSSQKQKNSKSIENEKYSFPKYLEKTKIRIIGYVESSFQEPPLQTNLQFNNKLKNVKIIVDPELKDGLKDLHTFEKIWVISYLHKSKPPTSPIVFPPWDEKANPRGVFATRSPHRPTPIGLSKAEIIKIEKNIIFLKSLDLLNGTPILDIKPVLATVDLERANNGWVENPKHLEEHKKGIPHIHEEEAGHLHEAADIVFDVIGTTYLLQKLGIEEILYVAPLHVGGGKITFSHGTLDVPAPATKEILISHQICWDIGPVDKELVTPTGASILAALKPIQTTIKRIRKQFEITNTGIGWGHKEIPNIGNYLEIYLASEFE